MQSKNLDQTLFLANHPLNFLLFYGDYEVVNTIYVDDGSPLVDLSMELFNQSPTKTIKFNKPTDQKASAQNHHLYLTLEGGFTLESWSEEWDINLPESKKLSGDHFYLLRKTEYDLPPKTANGSPNKIVLTLKKFGAAAEGGTRTMRAEMFYGPLLTDQDGNQFKRTLNQYYSYENTIFITNNRGGKKTLPLVGFAKGNAVLNDGTSTNSLELLIANKNWPDSNLSLSPDSQFVISFEMDEDINKEGAVATDAQVKAIGIEIPQSNKWDVQHAPNSTEWTVKPMSGTNQLASDETIKLNITNLVTSHSSGSGYLYVRYQNIPNYPDGQLVVPIEKTPLLYRDIDSQKKVGIGTDNPRGKLNLSGTVKAIEDNQTLIGLSVTPTFNNNSKTGVKQLALEVFGSTATTEIETKEVMRLVRPQQPGVKNANSVGFKVGAFESGISGKTRLDITLAEQPGGNNGWGYEPHVTVMSLLADGKVGIGTTDPSEKLHVSGNAIVSGKVGIGKTDPSAELHVNGRIKDKTGWVMPVGTILPYAGATAPEGWWLCNGDQRRKSDFGDLFEVIEYKYGGSGNNFNLPNIQGRVPVGLSTDDQEFNSLGETGGAKTHTLTVAQMPSHNHNIDDPGHGHTVTLFIHDGTGLARASGGNYSGTQAAVNTGKTNITIQSTGGNSAHNNLQPYLTVNYIIKY